MVRVITSSHFDLKDSIFIFIEIARTKLQTTLIKVGNKYYIAIDLNSNFKERQ